MVMVKVAPAAIDGVVIVTCPDLPLAVAVVVPDPVTGVNTSPVPDVVATKLPLVAVMFPSVAVSVVVVVNDPGVVIAEGRETVATPAVVITVIWLVVPNTLRTSPLDVDISIHVDDNTALAVDWESKYHSELPLYNHHVPIT
jgi:hypothetical protein